MSEEEDGAGVLCLYVTLHYGQYWRLMFHLVIHQMDTSQAQSLSFKDVSVTPYVDAVDCGG